MPLQVRLIERGATPEQTRELPVNKAEFLIGRGADCDLRLPVSAVSRHHCIIRVSGDEAILVDLGSSNGTYVNDQRVRSQSPLRSGDQVRLGNCLFLVDLGDESAPPVPLVGDPVATTMRLPPPGKPGLGGTGK